MEQEKKTKKDKKQEKPKKSIQREIFEWIMVFVVAAALAFVVRTFIFEPVRVDGSSMLNTLTDGEYMIATKFDYLLGDPERFDIVICDYPNTSDGMYRVLPLRCSPANSFKFHPCGRTPQVADLTTSLRH